MTKKHGELSTMERAENLSSMLREALKEQGLEVGPALQQPKTVPLVQVQKVAPAPQPAPAPAVVPAVVPSAHPPGAPAERAATTPPVVVSASAKKPETTKRSTGTSAIALGVMGLLALGATGGAMWLAKKKPMTAVASAATTPHTGASAALPASAQPEDTAVAVAPAARPAAPVVSATAAAEAKPEPPETKPETKPEAKPEAKPQPAPPQRFVASTPPATKPSSVVASAPPPKAAAPAPAPVAKSEPKPKPVEKNDVEEKRPAAPSAPAGSVDALLQQQLKGAIP